LIRQLLVLFAPLVCLVATARAADDPLQAELVARLGSRANYCAVEILNDVSDPQRGADFRACVGKVRRQSRPYGLKIFRDRTDPGSVTGVFRTADGRLWTYTYHYTQIQGAAFTTMPCPEETCLLHFMSEIP